MHSSVALTNTSPLISTPPSGASGQELLQQAFTSFVAAAELLQRRYTDLQTEVVRLRSELEAANSKLVRTMSRNKQMAAYLHEIVEALPCGVVVVAANGDIETCNPEAKRLFASRNVGTSDFLEWLRRPPDSKSSEGASLMPDVSIRCAETRQKSSGESHTIAILRDTTEERLLEQERESARRSKALAEISTILAHEIRNPLASLELFAGLLVRMPDFSDEAHNWSEQIQAGLRLLSATVNNVLQFHSDGTLNRLRLDLCETLRATVELIEPIARQQEKEIELTLAVRKAEITGDRHRLQQVFFNLAVNAFHAMRRGQRLRISLRLGGCASEPRMRILFVDEGCGISESDLPRIFDAGFSARPNGSPGLGLAVCRQIVEQHGGTISVTSVKGRGTTVSVEFAVTGEIQ
jgi:signal transduction histidine kinase